MEATKGVVNEPGKGHLSVALGTQLRIGQESNTELSEGRGVNGEG